MRPVLLRLMIAVRQLVMPLGGHAMGNGLHGCGVRAEEMDPARIIVEAGMVVPAGQALDWADEAVGGDELHHPVEGKAEEILGDAQDRLAVARRLHHFLRLQQQRAHAGLHIDVDVMRQQRAANGMVRRYGADDEGRFHGPRRDKRLQVVESRYANGLGEFIG